ncbi:MAG: cytochrome c [Fulvivirga sp.]
MRVLVLLLTVILFQACSGKTDNNEGSHKENVKLEQYMVEGQQLYMQHCSNCHQADGAGLAQLFPPLKGSDYMFENFEKALCSMKYGQEGEITVNGVTYNQKMPGIPTLTALEVAEISTYIYNSWGNERGLIDVKKAEEVLKNCKN